MSLPAHRYYELRRRRGIPIGTPPSDPGTANPLLAIAGSGQRRMQVVGNPYILAKGAQATVSRLHAGGHYYNPRAFNCTAVRVYLYKDTSPVTVRGVVYGDNGSSTLGDDGTVNTGKPGARLGFGTVEVIIPSAASDTVGDWYDLPITPFTIAAGTLVWPTIWVNAGAGAGAYFGSLGNTSHWTVNSNSTAAPYSAVNPPPADFTVLAQSVTPGRETSIYLVGTTVLSIAPTISATANADRGVALAWTIPAVATHTRITRQAAGGEGNLSIFPASVTSWLDSDLAISTAYTYRAYALCDNGVSAAGSATVTSSAPTRRAYVTASPAAVAGTVYVPTPGHNFIKFDTTGTIPANVTAYFDVMGRTDSATHYWDVLEAVADVYTFAPLKAWILANSSSGSPKRRVQFRIRCVAPDSVATNFVPSYIPSTASGTPNAQTPTWNGTVASGVAAGQTVATRMGKLIQAMAAYLTTENLWVRISSIDAGMLHNYGEFSTTAGTSISVANANVFFAYCTTAITQVPLILNMPDRSLDAAIYTALEAGTNVGLRSDSHSGDNLAGMVFISRRLFERSDRTRQFMYDNPRPSIVEWFNPGGITDPASLQRGLIDIAAPNPTLTGDSGAGVGAVVNTNFSNYSGYSAAGKAAVEAQVLRAGPRLSVSQARYPANISSGAAFSLTHWWVNAGTVAPFETWNPQFQLRSGATLVGTGQSSTLNLKSVQPTLGSPAAWADTLTFSSVASGTYDLCVSVPGGTLYRDNMRLAMTDEVASQVYRLGSIIVGTVPPPAPATPPDQGTLGLWYDAQAITGATNGAAVTLLDRSGLGRHATTSPTPPTYQTAVIGAYPVARFNGINQYLRSIAFTLSQPFTVYLLFRSPIWDNGGRLLDGLTVNQGVVNYFESYGSYSMYAGVAFAPKAYAPGLNAPLILQATFNGASSSFGVYGYPTVSGDPGSIGIDGYTIGGAGNLQAPFFAEFDFAELLVYPRADSAGQRTAVESYLRAKWDLNTLYAAARRVIVCDGDSLTLGVSTATPLPTPYPAQLAALLGATYAVTNVSVGAQTVADMNSDAAGQVDTTAFATVAIWGGTNDIYFGATAAVAYSRLTTYWAARRAAGQRVVAFTIIPRGNFSAGQETIRQELNALIIGTPSLYDALVHVAADSRLQNTADLTYFDIDTVHLAQAGYGVVAALTSTAIAGLP